MTWYDFGIENHGKLSCRSSHWKTSGPKMPWLGSETLPLSGELVILTHTRFSQVIGQAQQHQAKWVKMCVFSGILAISCHFYQIPSISIHFPSNFPCFKRDTFLEAFYRHRSSFRTFRSLRTSNPCPPDPVTFFDLLLLELPSLGQ